MIVSRAVAIACFVGFIGFVAYGLVYFFRSYFQEEDVRVKMARSLRAKEWWAEIVGSKVHLAGLFVFADGSCRSSSTRATRTYSSRVREPRTGCAKMSTRAFPI